MSIETNIKKWVTLDNNQQKLNTQIKEIRDQKTNLSTDIITYFSINNIKSPTINISDGKLNLVNLKQYDNTISYVFLEKCFNEYFDDITQTQELLKFIKNKRTHSYNTFIKRVYKNN